MRKGAAMLGLFLPSKVFRRVYRLSLHLLSTYSHIIDEQSIIIATSFPAGRKSHSAARGGEQADRLLPAPTVTRHRPHLHLASNDAIEEEDAVQALLHRHAWLQRGLAKDNSKVR